MIRSIGVLVCILVIDVILTGFILKKPVRVEHEPLTIDIGPTLSLSPYRYRHDFGISNDPYPQYTVHDFLALGYELRRSGQNRRAEDVFKTALLFDNGNPDTIKAIGEIAFLDGRYAEACNYFTQYVSLQPDSLEGYTNLAIAFLAIENYLTAELTAEKGLVKFGENDPGPFLFILACIKQKEGDFVGSEDYLRKACAALRRDLLKLVNAVWSASIKELPSYEEIISICLKDTDPSAAMESHTDSKNKASPKANTLPSIDRRDAPHENPK